MNLKERKKSGFFLCDIELKSRLAYKGTEDRVESRLHYKGTKGRVESKPGYTGTENHLENDQGFDYWHVVIHNGICCITVLLNSRPVDFNLH